MVRVKDEKEILFLALAMLNNKQKLKFIFKITQLINKNERNK